MASKSNDLLKKRLTTVCRRYLTDSTPSSADIEEEELLQLFDFAFDIQDYTKAWVLTSIARQRFPNSEELRLKIAFLLYVEGDHDGSLALLEGMNIEPVWVATMRLLIDSKNKLHDPAQGITSLVREARSIDGDSLYNLLTVAQNAGLYSLMKRLLPEIEEKSRELREFYIDMATWAENMADREYAAEIYNRLTMFAPMDDEAWVFAADFYLSSNDIPEAMNAVEYALAANPRSIPGMVKKAQMLMMRSDESSLSEGYELLLKAAEAEIDNDDVVNTLMWVIHNNLASDTRAESALIEYNRLNPERIEVLNILLRQAEGRDEMEIVEFLIRQFWENNPGITEEEWNSWAEQLKLNDAARSAYTAMRVFYEFSSLTFDTCLIKVAYVEMLYVYGHYHEIINLADSIMSAALQSPMPWMLLLPLALSWARVEKRRKHNVGIRNLVNAMIMQTPETPNVITTLAAEAASNVAVKLDDYLMSDTRQHPISLDSIDPYFHMPVQKFD